jgi:hypothetical protein
LIKTTKKSSSRWVQWAITAAVFVAFYAWMTRGTVSPFMGQPAPPFSLAVAAGAGPDGPARVDLSEMQDEVVVLDLSREFGNARVAFYAVNVEPIDRQRLQAAHAAFGTEFPTLHDRSGEVQMRYAIKALPTVIVVDRAGIIRWASTGIPSKIRLRGAISAALE